MADENVIKPDYVFKEEARKTKAEADKAEIETQRAVIELEREQLKRQKELATDEHYRVYRFIGEVSSTSVKSCIDTLTVWSRIDPDCSITIVFQSPGGEVVAGMALWDFLMELKEKHHLTTIARGYAASMAGILLQAGHVRVMGEQSWLLIHEASFGAVGSFGEVEDRVKWIRRIQERILEIFASRAKISKSTIKRRWHRQDWWIDSDEALKLGLIDEIR